ncbi:MAG: glutamate formimidoyltransferase [Chloroflexota bacterium]
MPAAGQWRATSVASARNDSRPKGDAIKNLLEAVPNFSEGRRRDVVEAIVNAGRSVDGVRVLDVHSDNDHNRTVLTLAGDTESVQEAVYRATVVATELIDLRQHMGEHPRLGATDVVPFIPLGDSSMTDAILAARSFGERVASALEIPVYFYEEAATRPERQNLENVRQRGFEDLRDRIGHDETRRPDLGAACVHATAGAIAIGARGPLIAYNIYLHTRDLSIAKAIAKTVRHSSGGLRFVKALGLDIPARGQVQVSMNLTNFKKSALQTVFNLVRAEAEARGVLVAESEIVGLVPLDALVDAARYSLRLQHFDRDQVLELKLLTE